MTGERADRSGSRNRADGQPDRGMAEEVPLDRV